ncbi:MAG TPA: Arc family DNA-binding protein [Candidatus Thermoplasmatota archaeon]|nr:Arc family DNA-binding protein [Candidatus Thermoplasmatota archaeon]
MIEDGDPQKTVNLKMPKGMRDEFKKAAKKNGSTMQSVMFLLAQDYIENSSHMKFKLVDSRGKQ